MFVRLNSRLSDDGLSDDGLSDDGLSDDGLGGDERQKLANYPKLQ